MTIGSAMQVGDLVERFSTFAVESPTSFHTAEAVARRLRVAGFAELRRTEQWVVDEPGGKFLVADGTVIAWMRPDQWDPARGFRMIGAHTDSPALKLKPLPDTGAAGWKQLVVETYGGVLLNSWLDRDLGLAGRVVTRDGASVLVRTGEPLLRIAQLALHLNRDVNQDGVRLDRQRHFKPLWGLGDPSEGDLLDFLAALSGLDPRDVLGHDLFAFDTAPPARLGRAREFLAGGRLDNLSSVYAALDAFMRVSDGETVPVFVAFDHEEVGSVTGGGAGGPLLEHVLERILAGAGADAETRMRALAATRLLSADAVHAVHPNYLDAYDPQHHVLPNGGPALKFSARQRYATDARGQAVWTRACESSGTPWQSFVSHNEIECGGTIGPVVAARLGVLTLDAGVGVLSMHSARELCGVEDLAHLADAAEAFLRDATPH